MPGRRTLSGSIAPYTLSSTLDGREWSASRLGRFNRGRGAPLPTG